MLTFCGTKWLPLEDAAYAQSFDEGDNDVDLPTKKGKVCDPVSRFQVRSLSIGHFSIRNERTDEQVKYGGLGTNEVRRLEQLEEENKRLKRLVTDLSLDRAMLQDVLSKKL
jgi:hypothetical protein